MDFFVDLFWLLVFKPVHILTSVVLLPFSHSTRSVYAQNSKQCQPQAPGKNGWILRSGHQIHRVEDKHPLTTTTSDIPTPYKPSLPRALPSQQLNPAPPGPRATGITVIIRMSWHPCLGHDLPGRRNFITAMVPFSSGWSGTT